MDTTAVDLDAPLIETCKAHPEVKEIMAKAGFDEIVKPGRLETVGRFMSMRKGCSFKGIPEEDLVDSLQEAGLSVKGYEKKEAAPEPAAAPSDQPSAPATAEERTAELGQLVKRLSDGEDFETVRDQFVRDFASVSAEEIAQAEQDLIAQGYSLPEMRRLCDVHSSLFHGRTDDECTLTFGDESVLPKGHPLSVLKAENDEIEKRLDVLAARTLEDDADRAAFIDEFCALRQVKPHYAKKEELLMPLLESYGYPGPAEVMWGVDDEIMHEVSMLAKAATPDTLSQFEPRIQAVLKRMREMLYKEEQILFPLCQDHFTKEDWYAVYRDIPEFGLSFIASAPHWLDADVWAGLEVKKAASQDIEAGTVKLPTGELTLGQLATILSMLPVDLTFIDADDTTRFFTNEGKVFSRPLSCLGRPVWSCHPPRVQMVVRTLIEDFKSGKRDKMEVWMPKGGVPTRVQYLAVRDKDGAYMGTLEIVQQFGDVMEHLSEPSAPRPHPFP